MFCFFSCVLFQCEHNFKYLGTHNIQLQTLASVNPLAFSVHGSLRITHRNCRCHQTIQKNEQAKYTSDIKKSTTHTTQHRNTEEEGREEKIEIKRRRK